MVTARANTLMSWYHLGSSSRVFCFHLNLAGIMFKLILAKLCLFSYLHRVTRVHRWMYIFFQATVVI